jgi:hypothetical protein
VQVVYGGLKLKWRQLPRRPVRVKRPIVKARRVAVKSLAASIRAGAPLNGAKAIAESTLTAIVGRESAYSGRTVEWDEVLNSSTKLGPAKYEFGSLPFPEVPTPGKYSGLG